MFSVRSVLVMMLVGGATSAMAAQPRESMSVVSIRVHDYAQTDRRHLQQAAREVSRIYEHIGVRLDWRAPLRPAELEATHAPWPRDVAMVTLVVLAPAMSDRLHAPEDVAGYAPLSRERGGRVAFIFGGRARDIATSGEVSQGKVLAGVMAHELAHLLNPRGTHSSEGVMRAHWTPSEFKRVNRQRFSDAEGSSIRQTVRALGGGPMRVAD
jgi:Zn-dependent protease with chaperone function